LLPRPGHFHEPVIQRPSRVNGSHHIFVHSEVRELLNLQEVKGKAKPYQVKQLLSLVERYNLILPGEE